jgi:hypothetical protein
MQARALIERGHGRARRTQRARGSPFPCLALHDPGSRPKRKAIWPERPPAACQVPRNGWCRGTVTTIVRLARIGQKYRIAERRAFVISVAVDIPPAYPGEKGHLRTAAVIGLSEVNGYPQHDERMAARSPAMGCSAESFRIYGDDGTIRGEQTDADSRSNLISREFDRRDANDQASWMSQHQSIACSGTP